MKKIRNHRKLDDCIKYVDYFNDSKELSNKLYVIAKKNELSEEDKYSLRESATSIDAMYEVLREFRAHAKRFKSTSAPKNKEKKLHDSPVNSQFMKVKQVLQVVPFSASTLWRKSKTGEFPAPIKISANITAWRTEDVNNWIESLGEDE